MLCFLGGFSMNGGPCKPDGYRGMTRHDIGVVRRSRIIIPRVVYLRNSHVWNFVLLGGSGGLSK